MQDWFVLFHIHESDDDDDDIIITTSSLSEIFTDILTKYINVSTSHFRKDYLLFIKREKGKAHRKKAMEKSDKKPTDKLTVKDIISDKSEGKKVSHLKLKAGALDNNDYFNDKNTETKICRSFVKHIIFRFPEIRLKNE